MTCPSCGRDGLEYVNTVGDTEHYRCRRCGADVCYQAQIDDLLQGDAPEDW